MNEKSRRSGLITGMTANALILAVLAFAVLLFTYSRDLYYLGVQEDEYLEWASFWVFLIAAGVNCAAARRAYRSSGRVPWFIFAVALFCLFVALEEISWGQRLLGYRPPVYFLRENFQQEFNIHNVVDTAYRKLALKVVILAYGVGLPLIMLVPRLSVWAKRLGIVTSPLSIIPAFLTTFILYTWYPLSHTGEWVEFMLGLGFLFSALYSLGWLPSPVRANQTRWFSPIRLVGLWVVVCVLGLVSAAGSRIRLAGDPAQTVAARQESEALRRDFQDGPVRTNCGLHKRLYTFVQKYDQDYLLRGRFAGLQAQGLPSQRAEFFLDPWNSPYWIRDRCSDDRRSRVVFIYSFGPNHKRDSTRTEIRGDDVGAYIRRRSGPTQD